jgi:hypothetical protein
MHEHLEQFFAWINQLPFVATLDAWISATGLDPISIGGMITFVLLAILNNKKK